MPPRSAFDGFESNSLGRLQGAALNATDTARRSALSSLRGQMSSAGLGRLGNALGSGSDAEKYGQVRVLGRGWSASGWLFVRSRSERTVGTIESYTQGAEILPRRGRWLWIATDEIPARSGRFKMTPARYNQSGLAASIGPLVFIRSVNGNPLLVVQGASVSESGRSRSAKSRMKRGGLRKGQVAKEFIVAFIGIPRTSRRARVDVQAILRQAQQSLPALINQHLNGR